jgi:hypothetical protein
MALRFDRAAAQDEGAWSLMCRMAAEFKLEDRRERAGRPSWDSIVSVRGRNPHLQARVVSTNTCGQRITSGVAA